MQGSQSGQLIMVDVIHYMESQPLGSDFESAITFVLEVDSFKICQIYVYMYLWSYGKAVQGVGLNVHHIILHIIYKNLLR